MAAYETRAEIDLRKYRDTRDWDTRDVLFSIEEMMIFDYNVREAERQRKRVEETNWNAIRDYVRKIREWYEKNDSQRE